MNVTGFFDLRGPSDLLAKLNHGLRRLSDNPRNTYAAFDFFVTPAHMHEWMQKSGHLVVAL